jgi:hypothetical protein
MSARGPEVSYFSMGTNAEARRCIVIPNYPRDLRRIIPPLRICSIKIATSSPLSQSSLSQPRFDWTFTSPLSSSHRRRWVPPP